MAKHPHKLILISKRTWKCALEGCSFFVHLGLAHVLIGKPATCWSCNQRFIVTESSLENDKPDCDDCRRGLGAGYIDNLLERLERFEVLKKMGVKSPKELNSAQRTVLRMQGIDVDKMLAEFTDTSNDSLSTDTSIVEDKPEVEIVHTSECASWDGLTCDCGAE